MCGKAFDKCCFVLHSVSDQFKSQEVCDKIVFDDPFKLKYCHDKYKTQKMCAEAVDNCLPVLKFVPHWFVASKIIQKLLNALYGDKNILYFNEGSGNAAFSCNEMGIHSVDFNNINFDETNYDEDDPETIIHIRLLAWHIKFEKQST